MNGVADPKAAIIGGGIAGLIAAIDLARAGADVTLYEGAADLGGRARTRLADGYALNQGPHAVYLAGALPRVLKRLGIALKGGSPSVGNYHGGYKGKLVRLPTSLAALAGTSLFSVADKLGFARVQTLIRDGARPEGSLAHWLDAMKPSPTLRAAIEALVRLTSYANAPREMSAAAVFDQMRVGFGGVIYLDGGWASLVADLRIAAEAAGVVLRTGVAAAQVVADAGRVRITLADGSEEIVDAALLALGPNEAAELVPGAASLRRAAAEALPIRANTLDLGLERLPDGAHAFVQGIDQPFYLSVHSSHALLAPEGAALVHVARYLGVGETPGHASVAELEAHADLAMPGWRAFERQRQRLLGMTVSNAVVRWDAARPDVTVNDAPGVFIAGDWVGEEGMLSDTAAASAEAAARAMQAFLRRGAAARNAA